MRAGTANHVLAVNGCPVLANKPGHTPSGLAGHARLALQFLRADAHAL
jgi:hypothetical protein